MLFRPLVEGGRANAGEGRPAMVLVPASLGILECWDIVLTETEFG